MASDEELTVVAERCSAGHSGGEPKGDCEIFLGGNPVAQSWDEYLQDWEQSAWPYLEVLKRWVLAQSPLPTGEDMNPYHLRFSDGVCWGFTWRAWGDLVSAAVGKREGYMDYYMSFGEGETWRGP